MEIKIYGTNLVFNNKTMKTRTLEINGVSFNTETAKIWCDELYKGFIGLFDDKQNRMSIYFRKEGITITIDNRKRKNYWIESNVTVSTGEEARKFLGERISKMIDEGFSKIKNPWS